MITDCVVRLPSEKRHDALRLQAEILRRVEGREGTSELAVHREPRPDFDRAKGSFEDRGPFGWTYRCKGRVMFVQGEAPPEQTRKHVIEGRCRITEGEQLRLSLAFTRRDLRGAAARSGGRPAVARCAATADGDDP